MVELVSDYYDQDPVQPTAIFHGFDFGLVKPDGSFGYVYNFLDYFFEGGGIQINARHYLEDVGKVSVINGDLNALGSDFGVRVLMFLILRYGNVEYQGAAGYESLPDNLLEAVSEHLTVHMQQFI